MSSGIIASTLSAGADAASRLRAALATWESASLPPWLVVWIEVVAILALEKLVEAGQNSFDRSVILALAYAQRGMLNRVQFYLDIAMRLAEMERPRLTLPAGEKRALGMRAGILYTAVPLDPDVRKEIAAYFVPQS